MAMAQILSNAARSKGSPFTKIREPARASLRRIAVGMSIAAMGFYGSKGPFFAMPPMFLSGAGLAAGIAWINSLGNLGGFFGPWYVGVMKDLTGSYAGGLYGLALLGLLAAVVCALFLHIPNRLPSAAVVAPAE